MTGLPHPNVLEENTLLFVLPRHNRWPIAHSLLSSRGSCDVSHHRVVLCSGQPLPAFCVLFRLHVPPLCLRYLGFLPMAYASTYPGAW